MRRFVWVLILSLYSGCVDTEKFKKSLIEALSDETEKEAQLDSIRNATEKEEAREAER